VKGGWHKGQMEIQARMPMACTLCASFLLLVLLCVDAADGDDSERVPCFLSWVDLKKMVEKS